MAARQGTRHPYRYRSTESHIGRSGEVAYSIWDVGRSRTVRRGQATDATGTGAEIADVVRRLCRSRRAGKGRQLQDHVVFRGLDRRGAGWAGGEIDGVQWRAGL